MHNTRKSLLTCLSVNPVRASVRKANRPLGYLCLALLLASFAPQLHAVGAAAPRFAYTADFAAGQIDEFSINATTGALTALLPCPNFPIPGSNLTSVAIDPSGNYLYETDQLNNKIYGFNINHLTGCLGPILGSPWLAQGIGPTSLAISTKGSFLFVTDTGSFQLESWTINAANGALVAAPPAIATTGSPSGIAVSTVGPWIYVTDDGAPGLLDGFTYNALGVPAIIPGFIPVATGDSPAQLVVDPAGQFLVVTNNGANQITSYPIIAATGFLGPGIFAATPASPWGVGVDQFGQFAYTANIVAGSVSPFTLNPVNGAPVADGAAKATPKAGPFGLTVDQSGRFLYVTDNGTIAGYTITAGTGLVVAIKGSPWPTGLGPYAIATTP